MPTATIEVVPSGKALGAEVRGIDLSKPLDDASFKAIEDAWHAHQVIVLPGQSIETAHQVTFGSRFGDLANRIKANKGRETEHPAIMYISNRKENGEYVDQLPDGEMQFHIDQCYVERPAKGTILYAINIPSAGGETLFSNLYSAYEALSPEVKSRIDGRRALNIYDYGNGATIKATTISPDAPRYWHPIVRTHDATGRKGLFVNRLMTYEIEGLEKQESDELLEILFKE
ncbi:MAG: TauD/TfdA dioxygenase family protein, partial [Hyphomicrobiaceae bacterium]